jgi:hypothetical protein
MLLDAGGLCKEEQEIVTPDYGKVKRLVQSYPAAVNNPVGDRGNSRSHDETSAFSINIWELGCQPESWYKLTTYQCLQ